MYVACGYVVARLCMNVFELAVDTMLQTPVTQDLLSGEEAGKDVRGLDFGFPVLRCFLVCEEEKDKIQGCQAELALGS